MGTGSYSYTFQIQTTDNVNNATTEEVESITVKGVTKYYTHGGTRVAMRQGDVVYYLHGDHLGSTSLTTDESGTLVSEARYHPYGEQRWTSATPSPTDFGFTAQRKEGFGLPNESASR